MLEQLIPEYLAQNMKEIDFDEPCWGVWLDGHFEPRYKSRNSKYKPNQKLDKRDQRYCTAPTWDQVFSWFHKEFNMFSWVYQVGIEKFHYSILREGRFIHNAKYSRPTDKISKEECIIELYEKYKNKN